MRQIAILVAAFVGASALAAQPRAVTPYPPGWPHRAPWKLERSLLLPETERIVFVVDAPRGAPPIAAALDHLVELASKHGLRPASWVRLGAPGAPSVTWVESEASDVLLILHRRRRDVTALGEAHVPRDDIETVRYASEVPSCPDGPLPANLSYVFVRYVGVLGRNYGSADTVESDASCGHRAFPIVHVAQTTIARERAPGIGRAFLEERALAHEYGHVLGLGSNPAHGRWGGIVPYRGGAHCVHRECAVAAPTARALLKGEMLDYCDACRRDIDQAREHWIAGTQFPESERLPQPDPAVHVARLKAYNFRGGGEADKLVGYGKAVMPALLARIRELPGGSPASPRSHAARLALMIVVAEDAQRRASGTRLPAPPDPSVDVTEALLSWWSDESDRFMGGEDWALPPMLRSPPPPAGPRRIP